MDNPKSAITASVEISMNTAQSPLLGTGKNLLIPVVSYTQVVPKKKMLFALVLQQVNAVSGDKTRANVSFSKSREYSSRHGQKEPGQSWHLSGLLTMYMAVYP
jgi:hypothetical protein